MKNSFFITIVSLLLLSCSEQFMVIDNPKVMPAPRKLERKPRVALVLGVERFMGWLISVF